MSDFLNDELTKIANPQQNEPTRSQRAVESGNAIKQIAVQGVAHFVSNLNQGFDLVWDNPYRLSPQEVCDKLGTDAAGIFKRHGATAMFLVQNAPATLQLLKQIPTGYAVEYVTDAEGNETGEVNIVETVE